MKRQSTFLAAFAFAAALPIAAHAAEPATAKPVNPVQAQPQAEAQATAPKTAKVDKSAKADKECEATATSRIRTNKNGECLKSAQATRVYTKEDLERTGQTNTVEALRRLDPSVH